MIYILLAVLASSIIANLLKLFSHIKDLKILHIFLGNYILATVFSLVMNDLPLSKTRPLEIGLGAFTGFLFLACFLIYQKNIHSNGISLSIGAMRFSMVIPTFFAILYFGESLHTINYVGLIIVPIAFSFLVDFRKLHNIFMLILLFIFTGLNDLNLKIYDHFGYESSGLFILYLFGGALIFNLLVIGFRRQNFHWKSIGFGLLLGIPNQLTSKFFMMSLKSVKASIAFPLFAAGVLVISILSDIFFWKQRFSRNQNLALILLVIGIILLNIQ